MTAPTPSLATLASTATITLLLVVALLAIAAGMVVLAVWLVRTTRTDPRALGPLEVMGDRSWRRSDGDQRTATLTGARPPGSPPPAPMVPFEDAEPLEEVVTAAAEEPAPEAASAEPVTETPGPDDDPEPETERASVGEAEPEPLTTEPKPPAIDELPPPTEPPTPGSTPEGERDPDAPAPSTPA